MPVTFPRPGRAAMAAGLAVAATVCSGQAALAAPQPDLVAVPCSVTTLNTDIGAAVSGEILRLADDCA